MNTKVHFSSATAEWSTPQEFFDRINATHKFNVDVCATAENAKCARFFTKEQDGLKQTWGGLRCWMNPPYGREIGRWVAKAFSESLHEGTTVVALLPARTDTAWWHTYIEDVALVDFIRGRLKFGGHKNAAPFPSALVTWSEKSRLYVRGVKMVQDMVYP